MTDISMTARPKGGLGITRDITPIAGRVAWTTDLDQVAARMEFTVFDDRSDLFPTNPVEEGSIVSLSGPGGELFRGIVLSQEKNGREPTQYTAFDEGIYLANNKEVFQFNNLSCAMAIAQVLSVFGIPVGLIDPMVNSAGLPTMVNTYYIDKAAAEIIKDILDEARKIDGNRYFFRMSKGKFYVFREGTETVNAKFKMFEDDLPHDATLAIESAQRRSSLENLRNKVKVMLKETKEGDTTIENYYETEDQISISNFGSFQEVVEVPVEDKAKAIQRANTMLADLSRADEAFSVTLLGDPAVTAGVLIQIDEENTGISGTFLVKSAVHKFEDGRHTMDLDLLKQPTIGG